jgi:uncharacterized membrane protein
MDKKLHWAAVTLAILGAADSIYMTIYKLTANKAMCLGSGDCSTVNASVYSTFYGIPVALIGVGGYLAILAVLLLELRGDKLLKDNGPLMVFGLSVGGFGFTLYLVYIEAFVLKAWCPFCVTSQITMTILFILAIVRLVRQPVK